MKITVVMLLPLMVVLVFSLPSFATECRSDLDCKMRDNEKCVKIGDSNTGECMKTAVPQKVAVPPPTPTPARSSPLRRGQFCMTNKDCDPGQSCVKKGIDMFGACY